MIPCVDFISLRLSMEASLRLPCGPTSETRSIWELLAFPPSDFLEQDDHMWRKTLENNTGEIMLRAQYAGSPSSWKEHSCPVSDDLIQGLPYALDPGEILLIDEAYVVASSCIAIEWYATLTSNMRWSIPSATSTVCKACMGFSGPAIVDRLSC